MIDCQLLNNNSGSSVSNNTSSAIYAKGALDLIDTVVDGGVAFSTTTVGRRRVRAWKCEPVRSTIRNVGDTTHKTNGINSGADVTLTDSEITATTGGGVMPKGTCC